MNAPLRNGQNMRADDGLASTGTVKRIELPARIGRALITGATGFLGQHLAGALKTAGVEVLRTARSIGSDMMTDPLPLEGIDHVFHPAAMTGPQDSWQDPVAVLFTNTHGTIRVLDQCRRHRCPVTLASSYVYGTPDRLPVDETHPARPNNPYALSKFLAEEAGRGFAAMYGLPVAVMRIFNLYGPGQSEQFLVPHVMRQVLDPNCPEIVVADLKPRRDYVHVSDVVCAFAATIGFQGFGIFNVGTGVSHSVQELIQLACEAADVSKPWRQTGELRTAEVPDTVANVARIAKTFGWRPQVSLAAGLCDLARQ
jgi:nucleoside-diphosphate-sugar epimerase